MRRDFSLPLLAIATLIAGCGATTNATAPDHGLHRNADITPVEARTSDVPPVETHVSQAVIYHAGSDDLGPEDATLSPNGEWLALVGHDITIVHVPTGEIRASIPTGDPHGARGTFSADSKTLRLMTETELGTVNLESGSVTWFGNARTIWVNGMAFAASAPFGLIGEMENAEVRPVMQHDERRLDHSRLVRWNYETGAVDTVEISVTEVNEHGAFERLRAVPSADGATAAACLDDELIIVDWNTHSSRFRAAAEECLPQRLDANSAWVVTKRNRPHSAAKDAFFDRIDFQTGAVTQLVGPFDEAIAMLTATNLLAAKTEVRRHCSVELLDSRSTDDAHHVAELSCDETFKAYGDSGIEILGASPGVEETHLRIFDGTSDTTRDVPTPAGSTCSAHKLTIRSAELQSSSAFVYLDTSIGNWPRLSVETKRGNDAHCIQLGANLHDTTLNVSRDDTVHISTTTLDHSEIKEAIFSLNAAGISMRSTQDPLGEVGNVDARNMFDRVIDNVHGLRVTGTITVRNAASTSTDAQEVKLEIVRGRQASTIEEPALFRLGDALVVDGNQLVLRRANAEIARWDALTGKAISWANICDNEGQSVSRPARCYLAPHSVVALHGNAGESWVLRAGDHEVAIPANHRIEMNRDSSQILAFSPHNLWVYKSLDGTEIAHANICESVVGAGAMHAEIVAVHAFATTALVVCAAQTRTDVAELVSLDHLAVIGTWEIDRDSVLKTPDAVAFCTPQHRFETRDAQTGAVRFGIDHFDYGCAAFRGGGAVASDHVVAYGIGPSRGEILRLRDGARLGFGVVKTENRAVLFVSTAAGVVAGTEGFADVAHARSGASLTSALTQLASPHNTAEILREFFGAPQAAH